MHVYGDTIDELIDGLSRLKDGAFINYFVLKFKTLTEEQLLRLDDIMLTTVGAEQIVIYAERRKDKINTKKYQNGLIELKNIPILIRFTSFAIQPNIVKTEDEIENYGKACFAVDLLEVVEGVNKERMKRFIFDCKDAYCAFRFIRFLQSKEKMLNMNDVLETKKIVLNSKDDFEISRWAKWIGDIEEAREAINKISDKEVIKEFNKEFPKPIIKKGFFDRFKK